MYVCIYIHMYMYVCMYVSIAHVAISQQPKYIMFVHNHSSRTS